MTHPPHDGGEPAAWGPPPYGPPPYGPPAHPIPGYLPPGYPPPPPPRKRRTGLIVSLVVLAAVAVAAAVVLPRALATRVLSRPDTERDVAQQFQERQGVAIRLTCDETMALRTGATYHCHGTTARDERVTLTIRITDGAAARYTWEG